MKSDQPSKSIRSFPVKLIPFDSGVIVKRGSNEIKIGGEASGRAVRIILAATSSSGISEDELCNLFPEEDRSKITQIVDALVRKQFLTYQQPEEVSPHTLESNEDLFYWHFATSRENVHEQLEKVRLVILGVNTISRQLTASLIMAGFTNLIVLDHPKLRNLNLFEESLGIRPNGWPQALPLPQDYASFPDPQTFDCLMSTSDFGISPVLSECNIFCVNSNRAYLPIFLDNAIGYIGPMVIPGETACFACLQARQNSNLQNLAVRETINRASFEGQNVVGFHPSMSASLAEFAALELTKFYSSLFQPQVGTLIEINLLATRLTARKVLKIPRCPICSPLLNRPSITSSQSTFQDPEKSQKKLSMVSDNE
jgi:bacteriocin biosynthesis cyclodehydratase domain-containing protein